MWGRDQLATSPVFTFLSSPVKCKLQCFPDLQRYYGDNALKTFGCWDIFTRGSIQLSGIGKKGDLLLQQFIEWGFFSNHRRRFCIVKVPFKHDCETSRTREKHISAGLIKDKLTNVSFSWGLYVSNSMSKNHIDSCWWFPCLSWNIDIIKKNI